MHLSDISKHLWLLLPKHKNFFVTWTPDLTDFRKAQQVTLHIHAKGETLSIPILRDQFMTFVGVLAKSIFGSDKVVISWDIKQLFSYLKFNLPLHWAGVPNYAEFIDLKLCEAYQGIQRDQPYTYEEAVKRTSLVLQNPQVLKVSQMIYRPLALQVLPAIETVGIMHQELGKAYSHYEIEGQANGRLGCRQEFEGCFVPHTLTSEEKSKFSCGYEKKFIVLDYKHMEVSVLGWLSKDEALQEIIQSGEDVYTAIYRIVSGSKQCTAGNRKWIKSAFLPVVYGMGAVKVAESLGVSTKIATNLIDTLRQKFNTAFSWVQGQQDQLKQNTTIKDYFGRVMDFSEGSGRALWSVRNAVIQGPAALICLEKLIHLYQQRYPLLSVVASIHDGYVCIADSQSCHALAQQAKEALESPSQLAPELVLKVGIQVGTDWGNLREIIIE